MRFINIITVLFLLSSLTLPSVTFAEGDSVGIGDEGFEEVKEDPVDTEEEIQLKSSESEDSQVRTEKNITDSLIEQENKNGNSESDTGNLDDQVDLIGEETIKPKKKMDQVNDEENEENEIMSVSSHAEESRTSRSGHLNSINVLIYKNYENHNDYIRAGTTHTHEVYYIKKQAEYNNDLYYLISRNPSSVTGVVGWVKSTDMKTFEHLKVDGTQKTMFINGSGSAYNKAWGGRKNYTYQDLSKFKNQSFLVNLTERIGNVIWYRGQINGKVAWIEEAHLSFIEEGRTSRLGHLNSSNIRIYKSYQNQSDYIQSGTTYTHEVYYIKRQATYNKEQYYLISRSPSSVNGVVGWVKSTDMKTFEHVKIDGTQKTMFIKGSGSAYTKAWGGRKNYSYQNLSKFKNQKIAINLTERVGGVTWYRGVINGKTAWIHESDIAFGIEKRTSRLGHLNSANVRIFKEYDRQTEFVQAGSTYTHEVYYIKKQATYKNELYYLISRNPSSVNGVVGWVKSTDMKTFEHVKVDGSQKTMFIKGSSSAYTKAWGGRKNYSYQNLSNLQGQKFIINLTERVGNKIWYRGEIGGKVAWIEESHVALANESRTSRSGHLNNTNVRIYKNFENLSDYIQAGTTYTHEVYYIKKQANYNGELYYLISRSPSSVNGVVGWVKSKDMKTFEHLKVDDEKKTLYITGSGSAYGKAWGGRKNITYQNLSELIGDEFVVNLTERIGDTVWYRGLIHGKTAWIHESGLSSYHESRTSRLGHLNNTSVRIYKEIEKQAEYFEAGTAYTHEVYYIKKQATYKNEMYYLISRNPSSINGVVGWVKASDLSTRAHVGISKKAETFYVKGAGSAYDKAWGGSKNIVYANLTQYTNQEFQVDLTEKVGNDIWYRGILDGKRAWIHSSNLTITNTFYTKYDSTFQEALNVQMTRSPQTDRYKRGYIHGNYIEVEQSAALTTNGTRLRSAPVFGNNISATVNRGTKVTVLGEVTGDLHAGSRIWLKINYNNVTLYVHSSLVNLDATTYTTTVGVNVHDTTNTSSHIFTRLSKGTTVNVISRHGGWYEVSLAQWSDAKRSDVEDFLNPDKNDQFQHLLLSSSVGVSAVELNKLLVGKGVLAGKGSKFIEGGKTYSVNEIYLIFHAMLETGNGTSSLATGTEVGKNNRGILELVTTANRGSLTDIKKVYNVFGIRAFDSCPLDCGAKHAYNQGWNSVDEAIVGGAKFIGEDYIHNKYQQNTIYKMRWNVLHPPKQYATDVGWAAKQAYHIRTYYSQLKNPQMVFDVPVFK